MSRLRRRCSTMLHFLLASYLGGGLALMQPKARRASSAPVERRATEVLEDDVKEQIGSSESFSVAFSVPRRAFAVGESVAAEEGGWKFRLYPKGRSRKPGERDRAYVSLEASTRRDVGFCVRLGGRQREGPTFDVESRGGARFVGGGDEDRDAGRLREAGVAMMTPELLRRGFVDGDGLAHATIRIEDFSKAAAARDEGSRAFASYDVRAAGVHLGATVVPVYSSLAERVALGAIGCYGGVDLVVERITSETGEDLFQLEKSASLHLRPIYPLVARLERDWPTVVQHEEIRLLLKPVNYSIISLGSALTAMLATVGTAWLLSNFAFSISVVPSRSMEPTVMPGDVLFVEKYSSNVFHIPPKRGEVVFFEPPQSLKTLVAASGGALQSRDLFVKRVVAVAGDHVQLGDDLSVRVNGVQIDEPSSSTQLLDTLGVARKLGIAPEPDFFLLRGEIFVLGDFADVSVDSRFWGPLPTSQLRARPVATLVRRPVAAVDSAALSRQ